MVKRISHESRLMLSSQFTPPPPPYEKTTYPLSDELIGQLQNDVILILLPPEFFTVFFFLCKSGLLSFKPCLHLKSNNEIDSSSGGNNQMTPFFVQIACWVALKDSNGF